MLVSFKEIYFQTLLKKCLWSQLLRGHVTDVRSDHLWLACNIPVNIYAANTTPTKCELFQDIVSKRTSPENEIFQDAQQQTDHRLAS